MSSKGFLATKNVIALAWPSSTQDEWYKQREQLILFYFVHWLLSILLSWSYWQIQRYINPYWAGVEGGVFGGGGENFRTKWPTLGGVGGRASSGKRRIPEVGLLGGMGSSSKCSKDCLILRWSALMSTGFVASNDISVKVGEMTAAWVY